MLVQGENGENDEAGWDNCDGVDVGEPRISHVDGELVVEAGVVNCCRGVSDDAMARESEQVLILLEHRMGIKNRCRQIWGEARVEWDERNLKEN